MEEANEEVTLRLKNTMQFSKSPRQLRRRQMDQRVPRQNAVQAAVRDIKGVQRADPEWHVRKAQTCAVYKLRD